MAVQLFTMGLFSKEGPSEAQVFVTVSCVKMESCATQHLVASCASKLLYMVARCDCISGMVCVDVVWLLVCLVVDAIGLHR